MLTYERVPMSRNKYVHITVELLTEILTTY